MTSAVSLMAIGMALLVALRMVYRGRIPIADPIHLLVHAVGVVLLVLGWLALLVSVGGLLGMVMFVVSLVVAGMILHRLGVMRERAHMALLALAVEKQIPLPACIDAFATEQGGRFARRAGEFSANLRSGMPLPQAIANSHRVLPRLAELAAHVGQASGRLAPAFRDEMISHSEFEPVRRSLAARMLYFFIALAFVPLVLTFLCIKIAPAFVKIFDDFDSQLPRPTQLVVGLLGTQPTIWTSIAALLFGTFVMICAIAWYVGLPLPPLPGLRRLFIRFDRATIQRALAFPAEQQRPFGHMLDMLALYYPSQAIRNRLSRAADQMEAGQDWVASLRSQSLLGKADAAVLAAAQRAGNLPWALREMADSNERRLIYRLEAIVQLGSIGMVLLFAVIVFAVAVAFILPVAKLIIDLT